MEENIQLDDLNGSLNQSITSDDSSHRAKDKVR